MGREGSGEGGLIGEAAHPSDLRYGQTVVLQKCLGCDYPSVAEIIVERGIGKFLEEPGEVELGESHECGCILKAYVIHVVGIDIGDKALELIEVLMLLIVREVNHLKR